LKGPFRLLWITILVISLAVISFGQAEQGRIAGIVKDASGALVPGVTIAIKNDRTGEERTALSGDTGSYVIAALRPSVYTVVAILPGFAPSESKGVDLAVGQRLNIDFTLKPANLSTTVDVQTSNVITIDTSSAAMGANVDLRELHELPNNGRQLSQFYLQAPGAQNTGAGTFGDIRFNGRAVEQNAIRFDGIEASAIIDASPGNVGGELTSPFKLQSSIENIQEFRVDSNNYPAEFGTGTGGQVSVVTKSGGNEFHGSVFEYFRNDALDARNFFDRVGKSPLRMNQFGGSIGGPIVKNKAFFFGSYEGYRLRNGVNFIEAVPNANAKARAVASVLPIFDAFRGPGAFTLPGVSTDPDFDIVQLVARNTVDENSFGARFDYKINASHSLYTRFFRDQATNNQPQSVSGRVLQLRTWPQNGVVALQSMISPTIINEAKFGYNSALTRGFGIAPVVNGIDTSPLTISLTGSIANTGIAGQASNTGVAVAGGLVRLNSQANGRGAPYTPWTMSYIDNVSWVKGRHNMKFGGEFRQIKMYMNRFGGITYSYSNLNNFLNNVAANIRFVGDLADASLINGGATGERKAEQEYYIGFAQDEYKVTRKVTLSYGLRYEYYTPFRESRDLDILFDVYTGRLRDPGSDFYKGNKNNFGPRLGIAVSPNGKTALRGGVGIYYGPGQGEDLIQPVESDLINVLSNGGSYPLSPATVRANFANNPNNRSFAPRAYDNDNYKVPEKVYQYSVSLQQELPGRFVMTAAYVGSQGRNLFLRSITNRTIGVLASGTAVREFDIVTCANGTVQDGTANALTSTNLCTGSTAASKLSPYAEIDYKTSGGRDSYDSMQLSVVRHSATGVSLNAQYTLGHSRGTSAGSNETITVGNNARDIKEFDYDLGDNNFDVRHNFNTSLVYGLPFGNGRKFNLSGVANTIFGGWQMSTIVNARSGVPINVLITRPDVVFVDAAGVVYGSAGSGRTAVINTPFGGSSRSTRRPDLVPGVDPYLKNDRNFINPAAFTAPKPGTFGNAPRNFLHGPTFRQVDFTLSKQFKLSESAKLDFRTEIFNIFNLTNFANPGATLGAPTSSSTSAFTIQPGQAYTQSAAGSTFGVLSSTVERSVGLGTNRQIQFAAKVNF
jgi:hypothetical protein